MAKSLLIKDTSIGNSAFSGCHSLTSAMIPDGVTSIGRRAFCGCESTESVTIPDSVTSIGDEAFYGCKIRSVTIPASVTSIGNSAFTFCDSLKNIVFQGTMAQWEAIKKDCFWAGPGIRIQCTDGEV